MDYITDKTVGNRALYEALECGALLLTVNNRLAARCLQDYNDYMADKGLSVWPTPHILPIKAWLETQLQLLETRNVSVPRFLTAEQEKLLWARLLEPDSYQIYMMPANAIARPVMQAWQLMKQWDLPLHALEAFDTQETQSLLRWSQKFEKSCLENHWQSSTDSYRYVTEALSEGQLSATEDIPKNIIIAGFEDPNQLHQKLFRQLQSVSQVSLFEMTLSDTKPLLLKTNDFDEEILAAAHWAKKLMLEDSHQKLAVVIPSLQENREKVERCFNRVLHPERSGPPPYQNQSLFNLSLGKPMSDYPLVYHALASLNLLSSKIQANDLLKLLQAPYLFGSTQTQEQNISPLGLAQRSFIDKDLRKAGRLRWTLKALLHHAKTQHSSVTQNNWQTRLTSLLSLQEKTHRKCSPEAWVALFLDIWKVLGWPGEHSLDSHEYQQSERLKRLLADFGHLQSIQPMMSYAEACSQLRRLCQDTVFQEQSGTAPLLVSGLLEAADQSFDAIWITGLDDQTLPAQTAPNPFIPLALQKQYNLPHSSAERELHFAENMLSQFCAFSKQVIFSYPAKDGDNDLRPSALLERYESTSLNLITQMPQAAPQEPVDLLTESITPLSALPENSPVKGGTRVLDLQAQCPFRANAEMRLNAHQPDELSDGTPPMLWGSQVHAVLEACWKQLKNLQNLKNMTDESLSQLIAQHIDHVLDEARHQRPDLYRPNYLALEKQRMLSVLLNWFQLELTRTQDFEIAAVEQRKLIRIGKIQLNTRIDRIDQLANGQKVILDYKTGLSSSSASWIAEQIAEPQLPLYSLALQNQLAALAFAKVHEKQCSFDGLAQQNDILPDVKALQLSAPGESHPGSDVDNDTNPDWLPLQTYWQQSLSELAEAYRLGDNHTDNSNCQYCDQAALCREHELQDVTS